MTDSFTTGPLLRNRYTMVRRTDVDVYDARDEWAGGQMCVVTVLHGSPEGGATAPGDDAFARHVHALKHLEHPSIPKVIDHFVEGALHVIVTEGREGVTLDEAARRCGGRVAEVLATRWAIQICEALEHIHSRVPPLICGDLTPATIFVNDRQQIRLGVLPAERGRLPGCREARSVTPGYAPPEFFANKLEPRSDIFALGATLFRLVTNCDPNDDPILTFDFTRNPRPAQINPEISEEMDDIVVKMVAFDPAKRFESAHEALRALNEHAQRSRPSAPAYCIHCAAALASPGNGESAVCLACGKATMPPEPDDTVCFCKRCAGQTPAIGQYCPWCGEQVRTSFASMINEGLVVPSPFRPQWKISRWSDQGAGRNAPICPQCAGKVRNDDSPRRGGIGYSNPPWNAGWDGVCEQCGYRFQLTFEQQLHLRVRRTVTIRPCNEPYQTFIDEGIVLSGVEITVTDNQYGAAPRETRIFLSMGELVRLVEALGGDLSVLMEQYDWSHDWT